MNMSYALLSSVCFSRPGLLLELEILTRSIVSIVTVIHYMSARRIRSPHLTVIVDFQRPAKPA
jgi:hypothetical protein